MKKTTDEELNQWRYQYPSSFISWRIEGDEVYAQNFMGEGQLLLWQVKNAMKFNNLRQHSMTRSFTDGTVIEAKSAFGQDCITINISKPEEVILSCLIIFLNLPSKVPPMQYPNFIKDGEIEEKDYFKTYYNVDLSSCPTCSGEIITLGLPAGGAIWQGLYPNENGPFDFVYNDPKIPSRTKDQYDIIMKNLRSPNVILAYDTGSLTPDPKNHAFFGTGPYAEILRRGSNYFIWKAYTELDGKFNTSRTRLPRNGLGYMQVIIKENAGGETICSVTGNVKVDCCEKPVNQRPVKLYWRFPQEWAPFIIWGDEHLFEVPAEINTNQLFSFKWGIRGGPTGSEVVGPSGWHPGELLRGMMFWVLPEIFGSCYPIKWEIEGPGRLQIWGVNESGWPAAVGYTGYWWEPEGGLTSLCPPIKIIVEDRCKTKKVIHATCCQPGQQLQIFYDTLFMQASEIQRFEVVGGCWPYSWNLTAGGGTLQVEPEMMGVYVDYYAPASNPNCQNNPTTIRVTDCCGNNTAIKITINAYIGSSFAYRQWNWVYNGATHPCTPYTGTVRWDLYLTDYRCDGTIQVPFSYNNFQFVCGGVPGSYMCGEGGGDICASGPMGCSCGVIVGQPDDGQLVDYRTDAMKVNGCCPINPYTGLPWS